jgi:preprotein translocase subunit SecG
MSARGAANALTRTTAILGAGFFATSLLLGILAMNGERPTDILNRIPAGNSQTAPAGGNGILDQLGGGTTTPEAAPEQPAAPASQVPSSQ